MDDDVHDEDDDEDECPEQRQGERPVVVGGWPLPLVLSEYKAPETGCR